MAPPPSYSVAPDDRKRSRILSWGALCGVVLLAIGALVLVFPKSDLLTILRGESDQGNRDLTIAYLRNVIPTEPKDLNLRLLLVEKLLGGGGLEEARQVLQDALPLAGTSPEGLQAWYRLDLAWWQAQLGQAAASGKDADIQQAAGELLTRLERSAQSAGSAAQIFLFFSSANALATTLGNRHAALTLQIQRLQELLLIRLLALPKAIAQELSRGGVLALGAGLLPLASDLFFAARRKTSEPDARLQWLKKGVQTLLATGQSRVAWQAALREALPLPPGDPLWWYLAELALGAGEPKEAGLALRNVLDPSAGAAAIAKAFNAGQLQLAWDTFAAAGDLEAALLVSEAALLGQPQSVLWLERNAQMSEWAGLAPQALSVWLELLKRGASKRALDNVFRLSPMLYDDDALLAAWLALAGQKQLASGEVASIIDVYERLGSVEGALAFIRKFREGGMASGKGNVERSAADKAPWLLLEAQLLDRAGRADEAIAIFEQLRQNGLAMPDALRLATLHLKKGNLPFALRALKAARTEGDSFNKDYWALLADVAYDAGEQATAEQALDQLIKNAKPAAYQAERAIRLRTDTNRIDEALRMAALLYQRFPEDLIVFAWLDALNAQKNPAGLSDLMMALKNTHRQSLEASTAFLERRAGLYARLGNIQFAKRDYTQALMLAPDNPNLRAAYWWLLVDQQETALLRGEIGRVSSTQRRNPAYSGVLTVAWQLLGEPRQALALMQRETRARSNDFLWLMNYADVLEQADRQSASLRVRRHAWLLAGRTLAKPEDAARAKNALLTQLRLAGDFAGGSTKAKLWRELGVLVNTSQASQDPTQKQQANELVAAWLLSSGRFDAAQRWLWQQHAARLAVPAYQQMALALAQNDKVALAAILEMADKKQTREQVNSLSPQDRLSALRELGRLDESASLGTEQALRRAEGLDDEAQQALQRDSLATASRANVRLRTRQDADLTRQEIATSVSVVLNPQLRLTLDLNNTTNSSRNPALIAATPRLDREVRVGLKATTPWGDITAQAATRDAVARVNGLYLQYGMPLNKQSTLQLEAALNERSEESSAMAITGVRSRVGAKLNLQANAALQSELYLGRNQFRTQTGVTLGSSLDASVNANWTLRRDYPDVRLQSQLRRSVMRAIGQPDAAASVLSPGGVLPGVNLFLGPSSTAFSTSVGVGLAQSDPSVYSRAWRPWGELGFETRQTMGIRQTQGLLRLGGKGTVLGRDQLSIHLDLRPGTGGQSGTQGTRELRLQYDIYFDQ